MGTHESSQHSSYLQSTGSLPTFKVALTILWVSGTMGGILFLTKAEVILLSTHSPLCYSCVIFLFHNDTKSDQVVARRWEINNGEQGNESHYRSEARAPIRHKYFSMAAGKCGWLLLNLIIHLRRVLGAKLMGTVFSSFVHSFIHSLRLQFNPSSKESQGCLQKLM